MDAVVEPDAHPAVLELIDRAHAAVEQLRLLAQVAREHHARAGRQRQAGRGVVGGAVAAHAVVHAPEPRERGHAVVVEVAHRLAAAKEAHGTRNVPTRVVFPRAAHLVLPRRAQRAVELRLARVREQPAQVGGRRLADARAVQDARELRVVALPEVLGQHVRPHLVVDVGRPKGRLVPIRLVPFVPRRHLHHFAVRRAELQRVAAQHKLHRPGVEQEVLDHAQQEGQEVPTQHGHLVDHERAHRAQVWAQPAAARGGVLRLQAVAARDAEGRVHGARLKLLGRRAGRRCPDRVARDALADHAQQVRLARARGARDEDRLAPLDHRAEGLPLRFA